MEFELDIISEVLPLLDIIAVLLLEDNPILGIALVLLLKSVTEDKVARISLILILVVLNA
jgi:hypothetical protein